MNVHWLLRRSPKGVELSSTLTEAEQQLAASSSGVDRDSVATAPATSKAPKIAHDWYQTDTFVVVTILRKKVNKSDVSIEFTSTTASITIALGGGSDYNLELELYHCIDPAGSKWSAMSTKVEVKLKKTSAVRWPALTGQGTDPAAGPATNMAGVTADAAPVDAAKHDKWEKLAQKVRSLEYA